jgi:NADH-quinone oxidoreductase subunit N
MFFSEPADDGPTVAIPSPFTSIALVLAVIVTVALGVFPQPVLQLAQEAAQLVR